MAGLPLAQSASAGSTSAAAKKWRVRAYPPNDSAAHGRVVYLKPTTGSLTSAVPEVGRRLDALPAAAFL